MEGKLIVFEGCDGSGKTTQAKLLVEFLQSKGVKVHFTREPTTGPIGQIIRENISSSANINDNILDALLFTADRRIHLLDEIEPKIREGCVVICDRYYHSTLVYENVQGLPLDWLVQINNFARKPDMVVILDADTEISMKRLLTDSRNREDKFEHEEFLRGVRKRYRGLAEILKERIIFVDASGSIDSVQQKLRELISKELGI